MEEKEQRINNLNPLTWAYIGDAVYELYIRENLIETTNLKPHKLHIEAVKKVKAEAQANILQRIEEKLTEEEKERSKKYKKILTPFFCGFEKYTSKKGPLPI